MRAPIVVHVAPHDIEQDQPRIDAARKAFIRYLAELGPRPTRSKYGLMGPVGKILSEVKSGRRTRLHLRVMRCEFTKQPRRGLPPWPWRRWRRESTYS